MNFHDFLPVESVRISANNSINSRKKVLETLANILAETNVGLDQQMVFRHLIEREKISSTALGNGIAIPHCRIDNISGPQAALLRISPGIDYDSPDQIPVTLFLALLVPQDAIEEHLEILANLAKILSKEDVRQALNQAADSNQILLILRSNSNE